jgi:hypothetical protein
MRVTGTACETEATPLVALLTFGLGDFQHFLTLADCTAVTTAPC